MKVSVKDFQIIKQASLELTPGLTVIQGESNNGKSALFRAVKSCIYNEPGTTHVRTGCKNYQVGIELNGHTVILRKGENPLYLIDGEQYTKIGKTQLEEVANVLGITALNINEQTEKINFWDQMEKRFLLDRNSSDLFRFIVDSGEDDNLNETLRAMVSDKNKLNTSKISEEGIISSLDERIKRLKNTLANADNDIAFLEKIIAFGPVISKFTGLVDKINEIKSNNVEVNKLSAEVSKDEEIQKVLVSDLQSISYDISKLEQVKSKYNDLKSVCVNINSLKSMLQQSISLDAIVPIEQSIKQLMPLREIVSNIKQINNQISSFDYKEAKLEVNGEDITKLNVLKSIIENIKLVNNEIAIISDDIMLLDNEIEPVKNELANFKICPYCGNTLKGGLNCE